MNRAVENATMRRADSGKAREVRVVDADVALGIRP